MENYRQKEKWQVNPQYSNDFIPRTVIFVAMNLAYVSIKILFLIIFFSKIPKNKGKVENHPKNQKITKKWSKFAIFGIFKI